MRDCEAAAEIEAVAVDEGDVVIEDVPVDDVVGSGVWLSEVDGVCVLDEEGVCVPVDEGVGLGVAMLVIVCDEDGVRVPDGDGVPL